MMGRISETIKVLIIINVLFFIGTMFTGDLAYRLFSLYYFESPDFKIWQLVTHMFMHGGFMHILFNMYALWAFGSPLEQRWGRNKFLFFYFSAGLGAALVHLGVTYLTFHSGYDALIAVGIDPSQIMTLVTTGEYNEQILEVVSKADIQDLYQRFNTPTVGASGAIYGVLVAFGIMFPNLELMLIFLPVPVKAKYFIPGLILIDVFFGISGSNTGIAHWAHIGGALFGFIMAWYWKKNSFDNTRWY